MPGITFSINWWYFSVNSDRSYPVSEITVKISGVSGSEQMDIISLSSFLYT
jgi:hypothetical protein